MSYFGDILDPDELSTISPNKKNPSGKYISSRKKKIVIYMYKDILMKSPDVKYKVMLSNLSKATGIGHCTLSKTIAEYRRTNTVTSPIRKRNKVSLFDKIEDLDLYKLRQKVHSLWLRREVPTINKLLIAVYEDPSLPDFKRSTLYTIILQLDFAFEEIKRCFVLNEKEDIIVWRRRYLYEIRKYRQEGRQIYYLDETWLNVGDCVDRVWRDDTVLSKHDAFNKGLTTGSTNPTGKGKRLIIIHIGSDSGFLPGGLLTFISNKNSTDYHIEMNGDYFKDWFESILPRLQPNSIIVMDNAPYHSVKLEKYPGSHWNEAQLTEWLISKGVVLETPFVKQELMTKVRQIPRDKTYVIDNIAKYAGHTVLRIPPYHCGLNPIEFAWAMVKGYVKRDNPTFKIDDVYQLLQTAIERVTPENWQHFIKHVIEEEEKTWKVDFIMDEMIDQLKHYVITTMGDTGSDFDLF